MTLGGARQERFWTPERSRATVLAAIGVSTVIKLYLAWTTLGTEDVYHWSQFAIAAREQGPIGMYDREYWAPMNHPPLIGWALLPLSWLADNVFSFAFWIRLPAVLADVVSCLLLFALLRRHRSEAVAVSAVVLVALSPLLIIVSGFHGNTDPVFVMFSLLALYLLLDRNQAFLAGLAIAIAVSIKLTPVVFIPLLLVLAWHRSPRSAVRFILGGGLVFLVLWVPVLVLQWEQFKTNVLLYSGIANRQWGLPLLLQLLETPPEWTENLIVVGRFLAVVVTAAVPAVVVWRRPDRALPAFALAAAAFLVLSPAFGMQYLVWPLAAAYLAHQRAATVYNALASILALLVYVRWAAVPVDKLNVARGQPFTSREVTLIIFTWQALVVVAVFAVVRLVGRREREPTSRLESRESAPL